MMKNFILWQAHKNRKTNPIPACGNSYMPDTEYCLFFREKGVFVGGEPKTKNTFYVTKTNKEDKKKYNHPTVKPEKIIENLIINSSNENDLVLDPYCGSGTVPAVCLKLKRKFIGIEIMKNHFMTANYRLMSIMAQQKLDLKYEPFNAGQKINEDFQKRISKLMLPCTPTRMQDD